MQRPEITRTAVGIVGMLALVAIGLLGAAAPAAAVPTPLDYDPSKILNDTDVDFGSAVNVTANQSQRMEFYLDCPSNVSSGEFDYISVWLPAGMDLSFHVDVDGNVTSSFRGYLVSPEYFRLVVGTVPPSGANDTFFNTTTRVGGSYYLAADGQASCLGGALYYNVTWVASATGTPSDGDDGILSATPVANGQLVSSSLTETTDQADFLTTMVTVSGSDTVLLRLANATGIVLTNGLQFEVYNNTSILSVPPATHASLSPNVTAIGLIQNGLQVRENTTFIIRMWSNGISGAYSFRVLIETYTPSDTNLDFANAKLLTENVQDMGRLNYTYERVHYHKFFIGNARTVHVVVRNVEADFNLGVRLFNEQLGTLAHLPREAARHNPLANGTDIELMNHYASASNLTGETKWYYVEVTVDDDLVPDGQYTIMFYFNDGPVGTDDNSPTSAEDTAVVDYNVAARFSDLDCQLDGADPDCTLTLQMVASNGTNMNWDFTAAPLLTVTPNANWSGQGCADFQARDSYGLAASSRVCVTFTAVNDAPYLEPGVAPGRDDVPEDGSITRLVSSWFNDVDTGDSLTITFTGNTRLQVTLNIVPPYVEAVISPEQDWNGCENITYTATDSGALSASHTVDTCVIPQNDAPTARGGLPEVAVNEDAVATLDLSNVLIFGTTGPAFVDIDGDALTYRVYDLVDVTVTVAGSVLTITPTADFTGLASFTVAAYDGIAESTHASVRVRVAGVNDAPTIDGQTPTGATVVMSEGESRTFTVTASDIDGHPLTYTWFLDNTGQTNSNNSQFTLSVDVTAELARTTVVRVEVTDGAGGKVETSWTVNIENTNLAPTVSITAPQAGATFTTDQDVTFSATTSDPDGDTLTYSWTSDRVGAAIGTEQTFTSKLPQGTHLIRLVVSDGTTTTETNVTIVVNAPPDDNGGPGPDWLAAVGALAVVAVAATAMGLRRRR